MLVALADAVVAELNTAAWRTEFIAERLYRPRFEPRDLRYLRASVVPRRITITAADRGSDLWQAEVDIALQQKLEHETAEEIDPIMQVAEEIIRYFRHRRLRTMSHVICTQVEHDPIYAVEHLDEHRCLTSVITLTFQTLE